MYAAAGISIAGLFIIAQLSNFKKYRYRLIQGLLLQIVFVCLGMSVMQNTLQARDNEVALLGGKKKGVFYISRLTEP